MFSCWGNAKRVNNGSKSITLNTMLLKFNFDTIDFVVLCLLLKLDIAGHNHEFYSLLDLLKLGWRQIDKHLQESTLSPFDACKNSEENQYELFTI